MFFSWDLYGNTATYPSYLTRIEEYIKLDKQTLNDFASNEMPYIHVRSTVSTITCLLALHKSSQRDARERFPFVPVPYLPCPSLILPRFGPDTVQGRVHEQVFFDSAAECRPKWARRRKKKNDQGDGGYTLVRPSPRCQLEEQTEL